MLTYGIAHRTKEYSPMSKRNTETVIYVARGQGWHITMDRQTRDFAAFIDGDTLILIGFYRTQLAAETAIRNYTFEGLVAA